MNVNTAPRKVDNAEEARLAIMRGKNLMRAIVRNGHPESLLCPVKQCYITGSVINLHKHHVYGGSLRDKSEQWGCWVWLRADWHNMSKYGVHFDRKLDLRIKRECQEAFEKRFGHEKFMEIFGKNYI